MTAGPGAPANLIVTGGSGYIGASVVAQALRAGCAVTLLGRGTAPAQPGVRRLSWALGAPLPDGALLPGAPPSAQALVHLAHDWSNQTGGGEAGLNLAGTRTLLDGCRAAGLGRFVFVSSQSARQDAANIYGRTKWQAEQVLDGAGEVSARVGLVYGGPHQAMFGLLCKLAHRAPVLPMIDPWRGVQPIHREEVARGLILLASGQGGAGWVGLAAPEELAFGAFLRTLALEFYGRRLRVLPVPLRAALLAADAAAAIPLAPKVDRERILGLAGTRPMACAGHLAALGLDVAPLAVGLRREPAARRAVLREARVLLAYVLGAPAGPGLERRYARAVAARGEGAIALPVPALLRARESLSGTTPLGQRLRLASALAEGSPQGEARLAGGSRPGRLAALGAQGALDAALLPVRLVVGRRR